MRWDFKWRLKLYRDEQFLMEVEIEFHVWFRCSWPNAKDSIRVEATCGVKRVHSIDGVQELVHPMLFICGRPTYRGEPVTFVYAVFDTPDPHQSLQHYIQFGVGEQQHQLTNMRRQITLQWLTSSNITADQCFTSDVTLADMQRQHSRPIVGNFTTHTFQVTDKYEVRFSRTCHLMATGCMLRCAESH